MGRCQTPLPQVSRQIAAEHILLTRSFILGLDSRRHYRNLNVLVVGGSGSGKFMYIRDDKDVLKLVTNLIRNTTPKGANTNDFFWEKSETVLLQALMLYLIQEVPEEEQNFSMVMEMLQSAKVKEDNEDYKCPLDVLFDRLEDINPEHIAVKQYRIYKQAAGDVCSKRLIYQYFSECW